jgi:hypothetical protein
MNAIAFCLDLILATLLLAALFVGLRLDRKLKALKDSQASFVGAVADLDASLLKAQDSLATLKTTAAIAESAISDRIQDAKGISARLDQHAKSAATAADKLERLLERYPSAMSAPRPAPDDSRGPAALTLRDRIAAGLPSRQPIAREALSRAVQDKGPAPDPRREERRTTGDDDLFELIEPALRAARSGRR